MKRLVFVLRLVSGVLVSLVARVFTVLEATLLLTLDFNLYESEPLALVQLVLKLAIAVGALSVGVLSLIKKDRSFLPEGLCALAMSAVMIPFVSNGFGLYFAAVSAIFAVTHLLISRLKARG